MSLHYLLDGYNILHQIPGLLHQEVDQQRLVLVREIERASPHGSGRNRVTLIFDGRPGPVPAIQSAAVKVIFSMDRSADDRIREAVLASKNARQLIVVTDDRALQYAVRAEGAQVLGVNELARLRSPGGGKQPRAGKTLTQAEVERINKELEERWLKGDESGGNA